MRSGGAARAARALCWLLALALVAGYAVVFDRYAVDFPRADDYSQILAVPYYVSLEPTATAKLRYLSSLSVEHPIATLRLAALAQAQVGGGLDFVALMIAGAIALACAATLVVLQSPRADRAWVTLVAVALFVSPAHYEAQYWATGALQHFGVIGLAFAGLWCFARPGARSAIAGFALAGAAALTSANGLLAFAAAAALFWLRGERRKALAAAIVFAVALAMYSSAGAARAPAALTDALRFVLLAAGSMAVEEGPAAALGVVLLSAWACIAVLRVRMPPLVAAYGVFVLASLAAMAAGRAALGDEAALLSRYRVYSAMLALVTLVAVARAAPRSRLALALLVTPATLVWLVVTTRALMPLVAQASYAQHITRATYLATGHGVYVPWPPQEYGDFMLDRAAAIGAFRPKPGPPLPVALESADTWSLLRWKDNDKAP